MRASKYKETCMHLNLFLLVVITHIYRKIVRSLCVCEKADCKSVTWFSACHDVFT